MHRRLAGKCTLVCAALLCLAATAWGQSGTITRLSDGTSKAGVPTINDYGDVLWTQVINGQWQNLLLRAGQTAPTQVPSADTYDGPGDLNNNGDLVLEGSQIEDYRRHIFLLPAGASTPQELPGGGFDNYWPRINDAGDVVWQGEDLSVGNVVYLLRHDAATPVELYTVNDAERPAINNAGDVVWYTSNNYNEIVRLLHGQSTPTVVSAPGLDVDLSYPDINDRGDIVWTEFNIFVGHAQLTLLRAGSSMPEHILDLRKRAAEGTVRINNRGDIVFDDLDASTGNYEIYLLPSGASTPIPLVPAEATSVPGFADLNNYGDVVWEAQAQSTGLPQVYRYQAHQPPTAVIAPVDAVHPGNPVVLDGTGSTDPDGTQLSYAWTLTPPAGSNATLDGADTASPTFTPDVMGDYGVKLTVNDPETGIAKTTTTVSTYNNPPVADAGPDQALLHLSTVVQLNGTASYDPDNDALTAYHWTLSVPSGSNATLDDPSAANPSFTADVYGDYVATLVVTDAFGATSTPDSVTVSFTNLPPVANAGPNLAGVVGHTVTLSGSGSDPNGDALTYAWSLTTVPAGSATTLSGADSASPSFTPDVAGTYVAQLIVNDGQLDSPAATASIEVITVQDAAEQTMMELVSTINGEPPTDSNGMPVFRHEHVARALTHELQVALRLTDRGRFRPALAILQGLERKSDGCARLGHADHNDWITSCEVQAVVAGLLDEAEGYLHEALAGHRPMHRHHRGHHHGWHGRHPGNGDHEVGIGGGWDEHGRDAGHADAHRR